MAIDGLCELEFTLELPETKPGKGLENYLRIMDPEVHQFTILTI